MSKYLTTFNCHVHGAEHSHKPQRLPLLSQVLGKWLFPAGCARPAVPQGLGWLPVSHRVKVTFLMGCTMLVAEVVVVISSVFVQHRVAVYPALTRASTVTQPAPR